MSTTIFILAFLFVENLGVMLFSSYALFVQLLFRAPCHFHKITKHKRWTVAVAILWWPTAIRIYIYAKYFHKHIKDDTCLRMCDVVPFYFITEVEHVRGKMSSLKIGSEMYMCSSRRIVLAICTTNTQYKLIET